METLVSAVAQHGYFILFTVVFLEAIGLPVPAAVALVMAGASSTRGLLNPALSLVIPMGAILLGDVLMYTFGRLTGWWLLGLLCKVSLNPETCILRSADAFYKRGRVVLLFAKFVPGINTLAPPLAGSMNMSLLQFLPLDCAGAALYTTAYWSVGYVFSDFLGAITRGYAVFGNILVWIAGAGVLVWLTYRIRLLLHSRNLAPVTHLQPHYVAGRLSDFAIFDVRSHGYYESKTTRIAGSTRLEPNALSLEIAKLPRDGRIVLYCTCSGDETSTRVARTLAEHGIEASVLAGGLRAWKKAGLPLEQVPREEVIALPSFS